MSERSDSSVQADTADWFARPIICVADVERSLAFYIGKLGFTEAWRYVEDGQLLIAQVDRSTTALILSRQWPQNNGKGLMFISLEPDDLDAVRAEFEAKGADVKDGRWGYPLMIVNDPDGNQLLFNYPAA